MMTARDRQKRLGSFIDARGRPRRDDPTVEKPWGHWPWECKQAPGGTIMAYMARPLFPFRRTSDNLQTTMFFLGEAGTGVRGFPGSRRLF